MTKFEFIARQVAKGYKVFIRGHTCVFVKVKR